MNRPKQQALLRPALRQGVVRPAVLLSKPTPAMLNHSRGLSNRGSRLE
ncbi:hypothetical protein ACLBWT_09600 [Paenibacillus sp. D51F]